MAVYIVALCSIIIGYFVNTSTIDNCTIYRTNKKIKGYRFYWLIVIALILLSSLRARTVAGDLNDNYADIYKAFGKPNSGFPDGYEKAYILLNKLTYILSGGNLQALLFVIATPYLLSVARLFLRYSKNPFYSLAIFICLASFHISMNNLRSTVAMTFIIMGLPLLFENKRFKFLICLIFASFFHATILCFLIFYLTTFMKNKRIFWRI